MAHSRHAAGKVRATRASSLGGRSQYKVFSEAPDSEPIANSFQSLTEKADRIEASLEKRLSDKDILTGMEEEGEVDPEEVAQQDTWLEISYMLICVL